MKKGIGPRNLGSPFKQTTKGVVEAMKKAAPLGSIPAGVAEAAQEIASTAASAYVQESNRRASEAAKAGALAGTVAKGQAAKKQAQNKGEKQFRDTTGMGPNAYGQAQRPKSEVGRQFTQLPKMVPPLPASLQAQANKKNK
jgi:hypothetical protein